MQGFRTFPPEIREMIFSSPGLLEWTGKTSPLLVALRQDLGLYYEALALFYKQNVFKLHRGNDWSTQDMSVGALQTISSLAIDFWSTDDWEDDPSTPQLILPDTHNFASHPIVQRGHNIRRLHLDVSTLSQWTMKVCLLPAIACAQNLPLLQHISIALPTIIPHRSDDPYDCSGVIEDFVGDVNRALGVAGKLMSVGARCPNGEKQVWFWEGKF